MEDQLITVILGGLALVGVLVKIVRDEVLLKRWRNGDTHNPNLSTVDGKLDRLKNQMHRLSNELALFTESTRNYRERSLEHLKDIREAIKGLTRS